MHYPAFVSLLVFVTLLRGLWDSGSFSLLLPLSIWSSHVYNLPDSRDEEHGCVHEENWFLEAFAWVLFKEVTPGISAIRGIRVCPELVYFLPAGRRLFWSEFPCAGVPVDQAFVKQLARAEGTVPSQEELPMGTTVSIVDCPNQLCQTARPQRRQTRSLAT